MLSEGRDRPESAWTTARLPDHPSVECIAIDSSHLGFGINPIALRHLARLLRD